jgi:uncharacterized protein YciI
MLIAITKYIKPLDEVNAHRSEHHQHVKPLIAAGKLLMSGRQSTGMGAVMIAGTKSREEFEQILANDPFVKHGLVEYQIIEFTPVFYTDALKFLFE